MTLRSIVRAALAVVLAIAGASAMPIVASAHALAQSSVPSPGSIVQEAPTVVTITFGETPDPRLSRISILDTTGCSYEEGPVQAAAGDPKTLRESVKPLGQGVYTVSWRTVSAVDGHLAAGSFAFGVRVSPAGAKTGALVVTSPPPTPFAIGARAVLFIGLITALGSAFVALVVLTDAPRSSLRLLGVGCATTVIGTLGVLESQREDAGASLSGLVHSSLAIFATERLLAAAVIIVGAALAARSVRRGKLGLWVAGAGAATAALVDSAASHAAVAPLGPVNIAFQWIHILAVGVWIGGLVALLLSIRGAADAAKAIAARRFSSVALIALIVVAITGVIRAALELQAWDQLTGSSYGLLVIAKVALILVLAALGGINRFRNVPAAGRVLRGLRRVGSTELVAGAAAIVTAAALVNVAPPVSAASRAQTPPSLVVSGSDYATTVRVALEISPGSAGFNHFDARITDYDTHQPVRADQVTLTFSLPARQEIGSSTLVLNRQPDGTYAADGGNLSLEGTWSIRMLIARGGASTEVQLKVTTPQKVDVQRQAGLPTLYTIHLSQGRTVQVYLDPESAGSVEFHTTFFEASGNELAATSPSVSETAKGGPTSELVPLELEPAHFVSDVTLKAGKYRFDISATAPSGEQLTAHIDITVNQ